MSEIMKKDFVAHFHKALRPRSLMPFDLPHQVLRQMKT